MNLVYTRADLTKLIAADLQKKKLFDPDTQTGQIWWRLGSDGQLKGMTATTDIQDIPEAEQPKEPYKAGDWRDPEIAEILDE